MNHTSKLVEYIKLEYIEVKYLKTTYLLMYKHNAFLNGNVQYTNQ